MIRTAIGRLLADKILRAQEVDAFPVSLGKEKLQNTHGTDALSQYSDRFKFCLDCLSSSWAYPMISTPFRRDQNNTLPVAWICTPACGFPEAITGLFIVLPEFMTNRPFSASNLVAERHLSARPSMAWPRKASGTRSSSPGAQMGWAHGRAS
ncbi:hypothetical protein BDW22DRAFT_603178 [Trametopsis cervina]|nr:hypothetical protein BDW22DRAFT_603178 [Trametopsis cervina]